MATATHLHSVFSEYSVHLAHIRTDFSRKRTTILVSIFRFFLRIPVSGEKLVFFLAVQTRLTPVKRRTLVGCQMTAVQSAIVVAESSATTGIFREMVRLFLDI